MIVLDTTVLVYAVGTDHPYRDPCRTLVAGIDAAGVRATTTVEVIQEFAHIRSRRRDREDARRLAEDFTDLLSPLLAVSERDLRAGLERWERGASLGAFDAVLAAAARGAGAKALVSSDMGFATVPGVPHVLPDQAGIAALLDRGT
ncbi:MAG: type II toxin-antitoxin system VapC family toxin [Actinomycetota bacterium]|nr:type II toxin-antitoxin system VapC family toxin [Actinomycetota bacterium]